MAEPTKRKSPRAIGLILTVLVIIAIGLAVLLARNSSSAGQAGQNRAAGKVTAAELVSVAKQVYIQQTDASTKLPVVGICGVQNAPVCPFTTQLNNSVTTAADGPPTVHTLTAGIQNGPFGVLVYDAVPSTSGGVVSVALKPSSSDVSALMTWKLTIVKSGSKLLVSDITYSRAASGDQAACGPVEIYNYTTCQ